MTEKTRIISAFLGFVALLSLCLLILVSRLFTKIRLHIAPRPSNVIA